MADRSSAYLAEVVASEDPEFGISPRLPRLVAGWMRAKAFLRQNAFLLVAALLQILALSVALLTPGQLDHVWLVAGGLLLIFFAMLVPRADGTKAVAQALPLVNEDGGGRQVAQARDTVLADAVAPRPLSTHPNPLPFIGERMLINADVDRLARAAARLGPMTVARPHPWGELMARVSHELRTPLNAVIGFSDVMNAELLGPVGHPRYREYARHIRDCGRELLKSAEDTLAITYLLDTTASRSLEVSLDLRAVVADAWRFYADVAEARGLVLQQTIPEGTELVMERRPVRQILINLFSEAVRRAEDGGVIGITTTALGDLVQIEVYVRGRPNSSSIGEASLAICLARALLEMQGASLIEVDDPSSTWRALTVLRRAAQDDFFSLPARLTEQRSAHLC